MARLHGDGTWWPICNAHYAHGERTVKPPTAKEADYPICKRCLAWWKPAMTTS